MIFNQVTNFHQTFGQLVNSQPTIPDEVTKGLRKRLLREEIEELIEADTANDIVELADALGDIAYIACGTAVSYGLCPDNYRFSFCEHLNHDPRTTKKMVPSFPKDDYRALLINNMLEAEEFYLESENTNNLVDIRASIFRILGQVDASAFVCGIPLVAVFNEIHASNMTKLTKEGKVLRREDGKVIKPDTYRPPNIQKILFPNS